MVRLCRVYSPKRVYKDVCIQQMPYITSPVKEKRFELIKQVLKSFTLNDFDDKSDITYNIAENAYPTLQTLKEQIIRVYPKRNTSRLRKGIHRKDLDSIRVLKEMLRYYNMTLICTRNQTRKGSNYKYKIVK